MDFSLAPSGGRATDTFADTNQNIYIASTVASGFTYADKREATASPQIVRLEPPTDMNYDALGMSTVREWSSAGPGGKHAVWEVYPANPHLPNTRFGFHTSSDSYIALTKSAHPFHIALNWILSRTGDRSNRTGSGNSYDVLPEGMGAEIDAADVNITSFEDLAARISAAVPNLVYGVAGSSFDLRTHLDNELLGPYNVAIVQIDGQLTLVEMGLKPAWDVSGSVTVSHDDIADGWEPTIDPDIGEAVSTVLLSTDYSWKDESFGLEINVYHNEMPAWALVGGRTVEWKLYGIGGASGTHESQISQWTTAFIARAGRPPVYLELPLTDMVENTIDVGDTVRLTSSVVPDMTRGSVGVTTYAMLVTGKSEQSDTIVRIRLANLGGNLRVASIAPAAEITAVNTNGNFTVKAAAFTDPGRFTGRDNDTDWYGSTNKDRVQLIDGDSLLRIEGGERVDTVTSTNITLDGTFTDPPEVGDYIVFDEYDAANTANQDNFAHFSEGGRLGAAIDDAPYYYVG